MKVGIIGAGAAGLTTAKHLQEEGIEFVLFDRRPGLGGLWRFDSNDSTVSQFTLASSSKHYLQFSDFLMEEDIDDFPHHTQYLRYLEKYAEAHDLEQHIRYEHEVLQLEKQDGLWSVTTRHEEKVETHTFEAVAVCSGIHQTANELSGFPGIESFQGSIVHSSRFKAADEMRGKRVIVVGGGESGADITHMLAGAASMTFMSLRKGMAVLPKRTPSGIPTDFGANRAKTWLPRHLLHDIDRRHVQISPFNLLFTIVETLVLVPLTPFVGWPRLRANLKWLFNRKVWREAFSKSPVRHGPPSGVALTATVRKICATAVRSEAELNLRVRRLIDVFEWFSGALHNKQPFIKSADFLYDLAQGRVQLLPGIRAFRSNGLVLEDGSFVQADAVVLCTGFRSELPFWNNSLLDGRDLYKNVFVPDQENLAFIGFIRASVGAIPPLAEMQARWFASVLKGRCRLPSADTMRKVSSKARLKYDSDRPIHKARLTSLADYHFYIYELAGFVGCQPRIWKLWLQPRLLAAVLFGPHVSHQYRLHGYGARPEVAKKMLLGEAYPRIWHRFISHAVLYFIFRPFYLLFRPFTRIRSAQPANEPENKKMLKDHPS